MNTPKPCDTCVHLYYNALYKDCDWYESECKLDKQMGNGDCENYKYFGFREKRGEEK